MAQRISAKLGTIWHDRGAEIRTGLYWTRKTKAKAVLVESFFCDNKDDYAKAKKTWHGCPWKADRRGHSGENDHSCASAKSQVLHPGRGLRLQANADEQVAVLKKAGFAASIRKVSGSVPYRVQVGTYSTKKAAKRIVKKLKAAGFQVLVKNL